jgi:hypothetical protein
LSFFTLLDEKGFGKGLLMRKTKKQAKHNWSRERNWLNFGKSGKTKSKVYTPLLAAILS